MFLAISVVAVAVSGGLAGDTFAANDQSVRAFHEAIVICAVLVAAGGLTGAIGIVNARRTVRAEECSGGQLVGSPQPALPQASQSAQ